MFMFCMCCKDIIDFYPNIMGLAAILKPKKGTENGDQKKTKHLLNVRPTLFTKWVVPWSH